MNPEQIKQMVQSMIQQFGVNKRGIVTSYQPQPPMVKVQIMPVPVGEEPTETGWIPVLSSAAGLLGNGWRVAIPFQANEQVALMCEEGDGQNFVVVGRYFSEVDPAPTGAAPGEILLEHESGAQLYLAMDGSFNVTAPPGVTLDTPEVSATGNLVVGTGATGTFTAKSGQIITVADGIITNIF